MQMSKCPKSKNSRHSSNRISVKWVSLSTIAVTPIQNGNPGVKGPSSKLYFTLMEQFWFWYALPLKRTLNLRGTIYDCHDLHFHSKSYIMSAWKGKKKKVADKVDSGCCPPPPPQKLVKIEFVIWRCEVLPWLLFFFPHWELDAHRCFEVFGRIQNSVWLMLWNTLHWGTAVYI